MRVIRIIIGSLIALFSLVPLGIAFAFFHLSAETWFGHPYYLAHNPFGRGCFWLFVGLMALLPAAYYAVRRRASAWWLGVGFVAALFAAVTLPSNVLPAMLIPRAEDTLTSKARNLANTLDSLGANEVRLPASQTELMSVAAKAAGPNGFLGPYYRDGALAPVRLVYVGRANGPILSEPVNSPLPAAIYCAVSPDRERFWITVTMLDRTVGGHAHWLEGLDGNTRPMVISGSVEGQTPGANKIGAELRP